MNMEIIRIESISEIHEMIGYEKPRHPLISLIEPSKMKIDIPVIEQRFSFGFYNISLKTGRECKVMYGRQYYDFQEGSLLFFAPEQVIEPIDKPEDMFSVSDGWVLIFHPDLIRRSQLAKKMNDYTFLAYNTHEALHVSESEKQILTNIVTSIKGEYSQNIDKHSQDVIISYLELMLNYCIRFYDRQFCTRTNANKDVIVRFEELIKSYFNSDRVKAEGLPSVKYCAGQMGYSPNYLSDLLKKETGKTTQEHINFYLIEKAKDLLLGTDEPIQEIASALGFEYSQHFSKFFKNKTGMSPSDYRIN